MKEIVATSSNLLIVPTDEGKFTGRAELVFVVSEPAYVVEFGDVSKRRNLSDIRFSSGADNLRKIADSLIRIADDLDALVKKVKP